MRGANERQKLEDETYNISLCWKRAIKNKDVNMPINWDMWLTSCQCSLPGKNWGKIKWDQEWGATPERRQVWGRLTSRPGSPGSPSSPLGPGVPLPPWRSHSKSQTSRGHIGMTIDFGYHEHHKHGHRIHCWCVNVQTNREAALNQM